MVRQSKYLASVSLGVMGLGFFATMPLTSTIVARIVHGGFEAGLVGGLADWFAVTALFRHPLGVPIPHTALLSKNRAKITDGIVSTLENDWLSKESITERLNNIQITEKLLGLAEKELQSDSAKEGISYFLSEMINHVDVEPLAGLLAKEVESYILNLDLKTIVNTVVNTVIEHRYEEKSLDFLLGKIKDWVSKDENSKKLGAVSVKLLGKLELDGLMQFALNSLLNMVSEEKLGHIMTNIINRAVENLEHQDNSFRIELMSLIRNELHRLGENQSVLQELNQWRERLSAQQKLKEALCLVIGKIKDKWVSYLKDRQFVEEHIIPYILHMINKIKAESTVMGKIEKWLQTKIIQFIETNHSKIGEIVKGNLNKLDDETLTNMIENRVGNDLQWIRVNGALCGFAIGIILNLIQSV